MASMINSVPTKEHVVQEILDNTRQKNIIYNKYLDLFHSILLDPYLIRTTSNLKEDYGLTFRYYFDSIGCTSQILTSIVALPLSFDPVDEAVFELLKTNNVAAINCYIDYLQTYAYPIFLNYSFSDIRNKKIKFKPFPINR